MVAQFRSHSLDQAERLAQQEALWQPSPGPAEVFRVLIDLPIQPRPEFRDLVDTEVDTFRTLCSTMVRLTRLTEVDIRGRDVCPKPAGSLSRWPCSTTGGYFGVRDVGPL